MLSLPFRAVSRPDKKEWIKVPAGTCEKISGGSKA
jgi:hypothetical protein